MPPTLIDRNQKNLTATIANGGNLSGAIDFRQFVMLTVHMPAAWTAASIGFHVSSHEAGTFLPLYDDDGTLIQIDSPAASRAYQAPAGLAGCAWVKLWSQDGAAANTAQGAARSLVVDLKA